MLPVFEIGNTGNIFLVFICCFQDFSYTKNTAFLFLTLPNNSFFITFCYPIFLIKFDFYYFSCYITMLPVFPISNTGNIFLIFQYDNSRLKKIIHMKQLLEINYLSSNTFTASNISRAVLYGLSKGFNSCSVPCPVKTRAPV